MVRRQSTMFSIRYDQKARPMVATSGMSTLRGEARFFASAMPEPITPSTAAATAIWRNRAMSDSRLGSITTMIAPRIAPTRVLRPPMITASRNRMVSSKL